jgi:hypothetical protein
VGPLASIKGSRILVKVLAAIGKPADYIPADVQAETRVAFLTLLIRAARSGGKSRAAVTSAVAAHDGILTHCSNRGDGVDTAMMQAVGTLVAQLDVLLTPKVVLGSIRRAAALMPLSFIDAVPSHREAECSTGARFSASATHDFQEPWQFVSTAAEAKLVALLPELRGEGKQFISFSSHDDSDLARTNDRQLSFDAPIPSVVEPLSVGERLSTRIHAIEMEAANTDTLYRQLNLLEAQEENYREGEDFKGQAFMLHSPGHSTPALAEPKPTLPRETKKVSRKATKKNSAL